MMENRLITPQETIELDARKISNLSELLSQVLAIVSQRCTLNDISLSLIATKSVPSNKQASQTDNKLLISCPNHSPT
jgi:hypothetical protein